VTESSDRDRVSELPAHAEIVLDRADLAARVARLGREIAHDHPDGVVLVGVLKGALVFLADLARAIPDVTVLIDFLAITRYASDSGRVRILKDLDLDVTGRDVVIVEDLVDTGLTLAYLAQHVRSRGPRQVEVCALLDRTERRIVPQPLRYVGEAIPGDAFVLGYGLHVGDRYRNLPVVVRVDREVIGANADAYLSLYSDGAVHGAADRRADGAADGRADGAGGPDEARC
jgi:hypoxanthine phosphoribosyltransferase